MKDAKSYLESAKSLLNDGDSFPGGFKYNASRFFLWLSAWEVTQIAGEKFSSGSKTNLKLLRDHGYKLRESPSISHIKIVNGKTNEDAYVSEKQKKDLRQLLIYGQDNTSRIELFMYGWDFNTFRYWLGCRIDWLEFFLNPDRKTITNL